MVESPNTASAFPSWLIMTHHVASPVQQDPSLVSSFFHVFVPSILLMCSFVSHRMSIDVPSNVIKCQFFHHLPSFSIKCPSVHLFFQASPCFLSSPPPGDLPRDAFFVSVACGEKHTLLLSRQGRVLALGDDGYGQCQVCRQEYHGIARKNWENWRHDGFFLSWT